RGLFLGLVFLLLMSCSDRFEGFSEIDDEVHFKYLQFGEGMQVKDAYYTELDVNSGLYRDGYHSYQVGFGLESSDSSSWTKNRVLTSKITSMKQGDSAHFRIPYSVMKEGMLDEFSIDMIPIADSVMMHVELKVTKVLDSLAYFQWMTELILASQMEEEEQLKNMLFERGELNDLTREDGIFYSIDPTESGEPVRSGDEIALSLVGRFLNDSIFDEAVDSTTYLYFTVGKADQVVPGIEQLLTKLRVGQNARVYCPSYKAFGRKGSSDGTVPPKTPVYFDFQVVKKYEGLVPES
ncbi:MAG: FKBP-type peptidyl-prolyl cis-trans isomerase, partial [Flavobacteriales bacterium]|nr:FKBP-type peptidyl-prolyl cis-trans isomerase [Flavobacteriales bacterium]